MRRPSEAPRCRWCGRKIPEQQGPGRRRIYCKQGCRQQAHISRKLAAVHGLAADEVIVRRADLEVLQGHLYELQTALEDVEADLQRDGDYREAYRWLHRAAAPFSALWIEPRGR